MKSPKELAEMWIEVRQIYDETRETTPKITADRLVERFGLDDVIEVFATVAKIKKWDERIYGRNRDFTNDFPTNPDASEHKAGNDLIYAGLDHIHTTHINQIITELREMKEAQNGNM